MNTPTPRICERCQRPILARRPTHAHPSASSVKRLCADAEREAEALRDAQSDEAWSTHDALQADRLERLASTLRAIAAERDRLLRDQRAEKSSLTRDAL